MGIPVNSSKQSDEPRKRLSKLRSVKVTNLDRFRLSMKKTKSRLSQETLVPDASDEMDFNHKHTPNKRFEPSPNYMKATTCFNARSGSSRVHPGGKSIKSEIKRMRSLKRLRKLPSMKSDAVPANGEVDNVRPEKLNLIRSGSIKITRVRSIKLSRRSGSKSRFDQPSNLMSGLQKSASPALNAPNLKHVRTLYKTPSLRSRRRPAKKHFDRATCSSALRSSKVPQTENVLGECEYENEVTGHVCPYSYCSLHGNLHSPAPPLKDFISTRRRLLKKQRSIRLKGEPKTEALFYRGVSRMNQSDSPDTVCRSNESDKVPDFAGIASNSSKYTGMWKLIYKHLSVTGSEVINKDVNLEQDQGDENQDMNVENQVSDSEKLEFNQAEAIELVQKAVDEILHIDGQSLLNPADPEQEVKDVQQEKNGAIVKRSKGFEKLRRMIITAKFVKAVEKLRRINPRKLRFFSPEEMEKVERVQLRHLSMDGRKNSSEEWMLDFALQQVISKLAPAQQRRVAMLVQAFEKVTPEINITCEPEKMPQTKYSETADIVLDEERSIELDLDSIVQDSERKSELDSFAVTEVGEEGSYDEGLQEVKGILESNSSNLSLGEESNAVFDKERFTNVWHMVYRQFIAQEDAVSGEEEIEKKEQDENVTASSSVNQADAVQLVQEAIDELLCLHVQLSDQQTVKPCKVTEQNKLCSPDSTDSPKGNTDDQMALQRQTSKPLSRLRKMVLSAKFINTMEKLRKIKACKIENSSSEEVSLGEQKVSLKRLSSEERRNGEEWMLDNALQQAISKLAPAKQKRVALLTQAFETFTPELQRMSKRYSRTKMQSEDCTATNDQNNVEDKFVVMDHGTSITRDDIVPKSDDPVQNHNKGYPDLKTKDHYEQEQTVFYSHEDEDKAKARYVLEGEKYSKMWKMIYQHVKSNSSADNQIPEIRAKEDHQTDRKFEITRSDAIKLVQEAVDGILQQQEKSEEGSKSEQNPFKGYSKWKRAIICTKFVKAMEKMQKMCIQQKKRSHYNPLVSDQEAETVRLRQCLMNERSNSEVWMLDYALGQVIAKLAPVQQKKVALLIEAFETVVPNNEDTTTKDIQLKMSDSSNIVSTAGSEEANGDDDIESLGESSESQDFGNGTNGGGNNVLLEGKKYSSMWRLIHQHIKSGIQNADAEELISSDTDVYDSDISSIDSVENAQLQQKDAIKLVEEAVNEILETDSAEEKKIEEETARQELPSVMSKVILCKKFIKAMEKMKKSKRKVRRYLPQQSEIGAENVRLRAQRMDDRNCEEWMLDYALQQVIGKLAPTQKKKVSLLVEAFEKVNPPPDSMRHQRFNVVA